MYPLLQNFLYMNLSFMYLYKEIKLSMQIQQKIYLKCAQLQYLYILKLPLGPLYSLEISFDTLFVTYTFVLKRLYKEIIVF